MFDNLSESQVEIHLAFAKELQVTAAAARLSLALYPVGQLQLDEARLKAHGSHGRRGGRHLDPLGAERENKTEEKPKLFKSSISRESCITTTVPHTCLLHTLNIRLRE